MDKKLTIVEERYIAGDVRYIEGFCETGADLPTDNIATGKVQELFVQTFAEIFIIDHGFVGFHKGSPFICP